jgi:coenzyme F420-reducing hydrogenase alpha subunit
VAAVEAPRGLLFHSYVYDENGRIESADCVIPTAQNLGNIEADLHHLAPSLLHLPRAEMTRHLEMLVRAYDPCISCSTHLMKVDFV